MLTLAIESHEPAFALVDETAIPAEVFGLTSYASAVAPAPKVSRREAIQVPAVKRCRDLIAGTLGTLPLVTVRPDRTVDATSWLIQPERNVPRSVTMTRTADDLLFEAIAWWRITDSAWNDYPTYVEYLTPGRAVVDQRTGKVYVDGVETPSEQLIRFDSPNEALLVAGARAIRQCLILDRAAQRYAEGAPPGDFFTPEGDVDPFLDNDEVRTRLLEPWQATRQQRSTGYIPAGVKYNPNPFNPEQLELAAARQHAVLEIARVAGVDAEELAVSTTSRTYANTFDRRKAFLDFTLGGYRAAFEDRLSMGDVTPRGTLNRFDLDAFLRTDAKSRYEAYALGLQVGAIDQDEIRPAEGKPDMPGGSTPAPALRAVPNPEQETA